MTDLYVLLANGRGDVKVTTTWDGNAPTELGMVDENGAWENDGGAEVSEPYRDLFSSTPVTVSKRGAYLGTQATAQSVSALRITSPTLVPSGTLNGGGDLEATLVVTDSDEKSHTPPRQHRKIVTWLVFTEESGAVFHFRKSLVIGWSRFPRT